MSEEWNENDCVTVKVNVFRQNVNRLEGVAIINGESRTDAVNRALQFYETLCTTPPGKVLSWHTAGEKHMIIVVDPKIFEKSPNRIVRLWHALIGRRTIG